LLNNIVVTFERETRIIEESRKRKLRNIFNELAGLINPFRDKPRTLREAQEISEEEEEEEEETFLQQLKDRQHGDNNPVLDELLKMLLELKRINTLQKCFKVLKRVRMGSAKNRARLGEAKMFGGRGELGGCSGRGYSRKGLVGGGAGKFYRGDTSKSPYIRM
jgi:hypothetical protein